MRAAASLARVHQPPAAAPLARVHQPPAAAPLARARQPHAVPIPGAGAEPPLQPRSDPLRGCRVIRVGPVRWGPRVKHCKPIGRRVGTGARGRLSRARTDTTDPRAARVAGTVRGGRDVSRGVCEIEHTCQCLWRRHRSRRPARRSPAVSSAGRESARSVWPGTRDPGRRARSAPPPPSPPSARTIAIHCGDPAATAMVRDRPGSRALPPGRQRTARPAPCQIPAASAKSQLQVPNPSSNPDLARRAG